MKNTIPKKIPVLFSWPKKIPASFMDPKKSLLAKTSDPKKSFGPLPPPSLKYVSGAPGIQSIPANSPGFPRSLPSFSSNLPISRLEHQISRIKWTFWAFLCYSLQFSQFFHKIRTFLFIYSNSPPLKHGDQISQPLEDSGNQIPSSPGRQKCQMPGVCPRGGGGGGMLKLRFDRYITPYGNQRYSGR